MIQLEQWINILHRTLSHTVLGAQEFRDNVVICYQYRTNEFLESCDGCSSNKPFILQHALQCNVGVLVTGPNNKVRASLALVVTQAFSSYSTRYKPIISSSRYVTGKSVVRRKISLSNHHQNTQRA